MGGEAKNPKRNVPIAVLVSLLVQGVFCYLIEYFAANYFLNSGYSMQSAANSAAPIGDMMIVVGDALFGAGRGRTFMLCEALTVFLALIGTTLSCMNTGARVTYAMGKDREAPEHFGMLHGKNLTPHRAIWTLAIISAVIGCVAVVTAFGDAGAPTDAAIKALPQGFWSSFGYTTHDKMAALFAELMREMSVDLPTLGNPTSPTSAISFRLSDSSNTSPGCPGSTRRGAWFVDVAKRALPRPPMPPAATLTLWPGTLKS